jgi:hypothetical protein
VALAIWIAVTPMPEVRREPAAVVDVRPDGEERLGQRSGLGHRQAFRHRQRLHFGRHAVLGVPAAVRQRAHPVPGLPHADRRAAGRDFARDLEARQVGRIRRHGIQPHALQDVGPVDARGGHPDQDLARARLGPRALGAPQHLGAARLLDLDRSH